MAIGRVQRTAGSSLPVFKMENMEVEEGGGGGRWRREVEGEKRISYQLIRSVRWEDEGDCGLTLFVG